MNIETMNDIRIDIDCGRYDCLKSCCDVATLRDIYNLMRSIGESDIVRLHRMLCGCQVTNQSGTGPIQNVPQENCSDTIVRYVCSSRDSISAIAKLLAGASIAVPELAIVTGPLTAFINDLLDGCRPAQSTAPSGSGAIVPSNSTVSPAHSTGLVTASNSWFDKVMDRLCGFDAWATNLIRQNVPGPIASVLEALRHWTNPIGAAMALCCTQRRVTNPWPTIDLTNWTKPTSPDTTVVSTVWTPPVVTVPPVIQPPKVTEITIYPGQLK